MVYLECMVAVVLNDVLFYMQEYCGQDWTNALVGMMEGVTTPRTIVETGIMILWCRRMNGFALLCICHHNIFVMQTTGWTLDSSASSLGQSKG